MIENKINKQESQINNLENKYYDLGFQMAKEHHWMSVTKDDIKNFLSENNYDEKFLMNKNYLDKIKEKLYDYAEEWLETKQWEYEVFSLMKKDIKEIKIKNKEDKSEILHRLIQAWVDGYYAYMLSLLDQLYNELEIKKKITKLNLTQCQNKSLYGRSK